MKSKSMMRDIAGEILADLKKKSTLKNFTAKENREIRKHIDKEMEPVIMESNRRQRASEEAARHVWLD